MAESDDTLPETTQKTWKRRGLFAAAWAAVAGVVLKQTTQPVEAVGANVQYSLGDTLTYYNNFPSTPVRIANQTPFGAFGGPNVLRVEAIGDAGIAGAYAGVFFGSVVVWGNFTVMGAKSAAVPHPDGTHRRLYCVESPESWFEDFGEATLACGEASIVLDPDFTSVADTAKYHVFLTGYDGQADLSVCERTPAGFQVRSTSKSGDGTFSWRVVAKRKDIAAPRFEPVERPARPQIPNIPVPPVPDPPRRPEVRQPRH